MSRCRLLLTLILLGLPLAGAGCRSARSDNTLELLNAEKRALEDLIYDWEYEYEILESELEDLQEENERLRDKLRDDDFGPDIEFPSGGDSDVPDIAPPRVDPGIPSEPPVGTSLNPPLEQLAPATPELAPATPEPDRMPGPDSPPTDRQATSAGSAELPAPQSSPRPPTIRIADETEPIVSLAIHPVHSQGQNFDDQEGDDGLRVVLQPRNSANQFVPRAGPVTLALLDPAREGSAAVIGRWSFTSSQVQENLTRDPQAPGIHLHVSWEDKTPRSPRLRLYARYEDSDGTLFENQREVFVRLPGRATAWTPRRAGSGQPAASIARREPRDTQAPATKPEKSSPAAVQDRQPKSEEQSEPLEQPPVRPQWSPYR